MLGKVVLDLINQNIQISWTLNFDFIFTSRKPRNFVDELQHLSKNLRFPVISFISRSYFFLPWVFSFYILFMHYFCKMLIRFAKWKRRVKKLALKMKKTKIMASSPLISRQIEGEKAEAVKRVSFLGLQYQCRWWLQSWN